MEEQFILRVPPSVAERIERLMNESAAASSNPDDASLNLSFSGDLKRICENDLGLVSQCCLTKHVFKSNKQRYLANVALKLKVKVGGRNTVLVDALARRIPLVSDRLTIIFGADVTHPHPAEDSSPSIAADMRLPRRPLIAIRGNTTYDLNEDYKVVWHSESWDISALEAIDLSVIVRQVTFILLIFFLLLNFLLFSVAALAAPPSRPPRRTFILTWVEMIEVSPLLYGE